jgi:hypothetical protein
MSRRQVQSCLKRREACLRIPSIEPVMSAAFTASSLVSSLRTIDMHSQQMHSRGDFNLANGKRASATLGLAATISENSRGYAPLRRLATTQNRILGGKVAAIVPTV